MSALVLKLSGQFWDSYVYKGRLLLFDRNGGLSTMLWDEFVAERAKTLGPTLSMAFELAFRDSKMLYDPTYRKILRDPEARNLFENKFERLAATDIELKQHDVSKYTTAQDNKFPCPHASATIYMDQLLVGSPEGLFHASCFMGTKKPVSTRVTRSWDGPVLAVTAKYRTAALSAGSEGLFEQPIGSHCAEVVSESPSVSNEWTYYSIFSSSHDGDYLASFKRQYQNVEGDDLFEIAKNPSVRMFDRIVGSDQLFQKEGGFTWGTQGRLIRVANGRLEVLQYSPWLKEDLFCLGEIALPPDVGSDVPIAAQMAPFGLVLEYDNCLLIIQSDGVFKLLPGEPVRWRTFPAAEYYQNQLHVTYEDHLEIHSFNHDATVDPAVKLAAIEGGTFWQQRKLRARS